MRRVLLAIVAVVLVNLPWANDAWVQHRLDSSGKTVPVTVKDESRKNGESFVSYWLPKDVDPKHHLYGVQVSEETYQRAVDKQPLTARVIPGSPNDNRLEGQVTGSIVIVIAAVGDAIIALLLLMSIRRHRRWRQFKVVSVEDDIVTAMTGGEQLTFQLADDQDTLSRLRPGVGATIRGELYLVPRDDVVDGPPIGEITHLRGPEYRMAGRARAVSAVRTDILLENGFVMPVIGDEVRHEAELRGPATATGTLMLAFRRPR
ncbi:MAG TPA: hypothetical protein VN108_06250 [Marmoricola sp.]|nr:hypothetical protein [Marmoricola sp.]